MNVLLTGGTGFIGGYVLRYLLDAGHHVKLLVRDSSQVVEGHHPRVSVFPGGLNDADARCRSMAGCDVVIHLAAVVAATARSESAFNDTNLQGTRDLLQDAQENGIRKFVFASSLSAHCIGPNLMADEESLRDRTEHFCEYSKTKGLAEKLVLASGLPYIIVYPTRVFGIGPLKDSNAATKVLSLFLKNRLPFLIEGGEQYSSWAFVEDVAHGIVSAATGVVMNQKYILGGENKTLAGVYRLTDLISRKKHLKISLKTRTAISLASVLELEATLLRRKPLITRQWLAYVLESQQLSSAKAIRELDYHITSFETALEKTILWLQTSQAQSQPRLTRPPNQ